MKVIKVEDLFEYYYSHAGECNPKKQLWFIRISSGSLEKFIKQKSFELHIDDSYKRKLPDCKCEYCKKSFEIPEVKDES